MNLSQNGIALLKDVQRAIEVVNGSVTSTINQNQFDALVSLVVDITPQGFLSSHMRQMINDKDMDGAAEAFLLHTKKHAHGMYVEQVGWRAKRLAEQALFTTEIEDVGTKDDVQREWNALDSLVRGVPSGGVPGPEGGVDDRVGPHKGRKGRGHMLVEPGPTVAVGGSS
jgi:hypothetical protein